jgi:uncharacterized radical SAM superfamily Fe-S cluster-containing enzyme
VLNPRLSSVAQGQRIPCEAIDFVKRCVIHYAAPNGRIYPFCAYNSGPVYRARIEKEFSVPFEEQEEMRRLTLEGRTRPTAVTELELVG